MSAGAAVLIVRAIIANAANTFAAAGTDLERRKRGRCTYAERHNADLRWEGGQVASNH
jgi:hypothetical protein